jgi:hypothetical protein
MLLPLLCCCSSQGVGNTAAAAKEAGVQRVVLVSSMLTHPANRWAAQSRGSGLAVVAISYVQYNSMMLAQTGK